MSNSGSVAVAKTNSPGIITLEKVAGKHSLEGKDAGRWSRFFTKDGVHPFDEIEWKIVTAEIVSPSGEVKFRQENVEVPAWWGRTATNIVADKYFRVIDGVREHSVKQVFTRVASVLRSWAEEQDYFNSDDDAEVYEAELIYALLHQKGAFNSPVWFNLGVPGRRQTASACFISGVDDTLDSIMEFSKAEKVIFAGGSGSGANMSKIRSSYEKLSSGAYVCGPLGWMEELDKGAKAMKSGGSTRNAAKMVVLDMDHPDILETFDGRPGFIACKAVEEKRAHDLIDLGYGAAYDDPNSAYKWVSFQNANHSVSVPDAFMEAVEEDEEWATVSRTSDEVVKRYKARDLWDEIAKAAWLCGDPGVQFTDTINKWHTTPNSGRINSSNPCFAAETKISTEFGLVSIADLYERVLDGEVKVAVHLGDRIEMRPAVVFPTGNNPILEVKFKSGRALCVTPNHNFLLRDGTRKPAAELSSGDSVDIQCGEGSFGDYGIGLPDTTFWYQMAGFVVGDGWMTKYKINSKQHRDRGWKSEYDRQEIGMCFGKDDKDILAKIEGFLQSKEIPYSIKRQKGSVGESPDYLRIYRKTLFEMMELIASPAGCRSHTKRVQMGVFEASRVNQFAFLSGLFSADGTFRLASKGYGGNIPAREFRLSSVNLDLLRDVQSLLSNLGIKSNIIQDRNVSRRGKFEYVTASGERRIYNSNRNVHELFVYGHSLRKLRDGMTEAGGMFSSRKQVMLDELLPSGHSDPIHDIWHDEVTEVVDTGREELTYNMTESTTHTIIADGVRIPQCSEFLHVDNTACNLCAVNLTRFFDGRQFKVDDFEHVIRIFVTAQNAIIAKAEYPTDVIEKNSHALRPIGLNYGDLGALLMKLGYGYDSDEGRSIAARLASLMTGFAYLTSARLAARVGPFPEFDANCDEMLSVMKMHQKEDLRINSRWSQESDLLDVSKKSAGVWEQVIRLGNAFGYSISQATLQAPLGTISFLMEMDTTGIEPSFSLVSYKSMVGGGFEKLVNRAVRESLENLGYLPDQVAEICSYMEENGFIEGAPGLNGAHLPIFDCAMPLGPSKRHLSPMAHLKMMAAIQPLITCAQSKTVNLPKEVTPEEIAETYMEGWKLGLKCIALYRDGCKKSQPLATKKRSDEQQEVRVKEVIKEVTKRRHLPEDCPGLRHRFDINGHKGYIMVNEFPDGTPGEVFLRLGKSGSTMEGTINGFTMLLSIALQYGVPLDKLIRSFVNTRFEPSGFTKNPKIRIAQSIFDYLFKHLDLLYYGGENTGLARRMVESIPPESSLDSDPPSSQDAPSSLSLDAPPCPVCGSITRRNGSCYLCDTCGTSTGCS